jgi:hypothetical protein
MALGAAGCGPARTGMTLAECNTRHGGLGARRTVVPVCVDTARGAMPVEAEYIPGVVDCELGWFTTAAPALEAQAIAARTYLVGWLDRKGDEARKVPIGPHFQCWRKAAHQRSRAAAQATKDVVMHLNGQFIYANYASGARKRDADCRALPPDQHGYSAKSWAAMRAAYDAARAQGRRKPFHGAYWTEVLVTHNAGKSADAITETPFARKGPLNRGAFGQYEAACLAKEKGLETMAILEHFYGKDLDFSVAWSPEDAQRLRALVDDDGATEAEPPAPATEPRDDS